MSTKKKEKRAALSPPRGWKMEILSNVPVHAAKRWRQAIDEGGPDTRDEAEVRGAEDKYPAPSGVSPPNRIRVVLLNPRNAATPEQVLHWAKSRGQRPLTARECFCIGAWERNVPERLRIEPSTDPFVILTLDSGEYSEDQKKAPFVGWDAPTVEPDMHEQVCGLLSADNIDAFGKDYWFAFTDEKKKPQSRKR